MLVLLAATASAGDTIVLTNGRVIQADRAWFEGAQLLYERSGAVFGLPRSLVKSVEAQTPPAAAPDPNVTLAQEFARAGRDAEAIRVLRAALQREPRNLPALHLVAEASLRLRDF